MYPTQKPKKKKNHKDISLHPVLRNMATMKIQISRGDFVRRRKDSSYGSHVVNILQSSTGSCSTLNKLSPNRNAHHKKCRRITAEEKQNRRNKYFYRRLNTEMRGAEITH
ncbi:hypothetical protein EUGRSUZ_J00192 [Eucalyptus grandis]|uniref:Uncharacterized protein n=2 Tax=Eucalyptus grandis TaxID=71139 RepID=A0ACC3J2K7_EUCGR|nr:hypothetical protein EUGRSUZ_J00192 [Eucalyptus grandis]